MPFFFYTEFSSFFFLCGNCSLKDDDSGDHDQDNGSPKDGEKERNEDEEKDQNTTKRKVCDWVCL